MHSRRWCDPPQSAAVSGIIRVMLGEMPQMLREILAHALMNEAEMELVSESPTGRGRETDVPPDVVLVAIEKYHDPQSAAALLARWPDARIIAIEQSGRVTTMYELRPHKVELGELSPAGIVSSIRTAVSGGAHAGSRPACSH